MPLPNRSRMGFSFFLFLASPNVLYFCILLDIWVLREPTFPAKNKNKKTLTVRQGHVKHVCKMSGPTSQKWRGHLDLWAVNVQKITASHRNYLVLV